MGRTAWKQKQMIFLAAALRGCHGMHAGRAADEALDPAAAPGSFLAEHFSYDLRVLSFGVLQQPVNSTQNPSNNFLQLQRYVGDGELRPDLRLSLSNLDLSAKPRVRLDYSSGRTARARETPIGTTTSLSTSGSPGSRSGRTSSSLTAGRTSSGARPYLFSPSNPFFQDNGRRNTYLEVPGMDFGRLVWIPAAAWSFSFIANTDPGLNRTTGPGAFLSTTPPPPFERTYTVKADYTGREAYASLILLEEAGRRERCWVSSGGGPQRTRSSFTVRGRSPRAARGSIPWRTASPPSARPWRRSTSTTPALYPALLIGGILHLRVKGILTVNTPITVRGTAQHDAETYYDLRRRGAQSFALAGPISGLGRRPSGETADDGLEVPAEELRPSPVHPDKYPEQDRPHLSVGPEPRRRIGPVHRAGLLLPWASTWSFSRWVPSWQAARTRNSGASSITS